MGLPGQGASRAFGPLLGRLGLELLRSQRLPAVAAAGAARVAARQRGWGGWGLLPGGGVLAPWEYRHQGSASRRTR